MKKALICAFIGSMALFGSSCGGSEKSSVEEPDALVQIGDSVLTLSAVVDRIPTGLSAEDSTTLFRAIVDDWVKEQLLSEVAMRNIANSEKIEEMVRNYRNTLIINEYRAIMKRNHRSEANDKAIREYYIANADDMLLERPLVKGIYIKIPADAQQADKVRKWVFSAGKADIDKLEKYGLKEAMQYDWFGDKWVDWQVIADQIPYRFSDPDAFVKSSTNFETEHNGSLYLLHISEALTSGDKMPFDFARDRIADILSTEADRNYDGELVRSLYEKGVREGTVKPLTYNPLTHKKIINKNLDKQ